MIQPSDLDLHEGRNLLCISGLNHQSIMLGKVFKLLIKENAGLDEQTEVAKSIPSPYEEATNCFFLTEISKPSNANILDSSIQYSKDQCCH
jgi:hypothetical protein